MPSLAEALMRNFLLAQRERPGLTKGQYMQRAFPNRYKNEQSGYQAFNQIIRGRRPGGRLPVEPERYVMIRGEKRPTSYQTGLWKVIIHFNATDGDGNTLEDQEVSFNAESYEHTNLLAVPYLEDAILPTAEQYLTDLSSATQSFSSAQITYIEVIPINSVRVQPVDLDTLYI